MGRTGKKTNEPLRSGCTLSVISKLCSLKISKPLTPLHPSRLCTEGATGGAMGGGFRSPAGAMGTPTGPAPSEPPLNIFPAEISQPLLTLPPLYTTPLCRHSPSPVHLVIYTMRRSLTTEEKMQPALRWRLFFLRFLEALSTLHRSGAETASNWRQSRQQPGVKINGGKIL